MNRLLRTLTIAVTAIGALQLYRRSRTEAGHGRHRLPVETWENEGGALPEVASAATRDTRPAAGRS